MTQTRPPLKVFLTVDTELWPLVEEWPRKPLPQDKRSFEQEHDIYILGKTAKTLCTQPEHVPKTLKRFLDELEEYKQKIGNN